tara:strand:+ start:2630 stop:2833 length:204 start_codon:yes stop_codon:yes gene_type:complete
MVQVLLDEETIDKLQKLIMLEAVENNEPMLGKSAWVRNLIEDTVNFQLNKEKLAGWKPGILKKLKSK